MDPTKTTRKKLLGFSLINYIINASNNEHFSYNNELLNNIEAIMGKEIFCCFLRKSIVDNFQQLFGSDFFFDLVIIK